MGLSEEPTVRATQLANLTPAPPAPPGNQRARSHGAYSDKLVGPFADALVDDVFEANPHLDPRRDRPAVVRYATVIARTEHVRAWLDEQDDPVFADRSEGEAHAVFNRLEAWEKQAESMERALVLTPLTREQLGLVRLQTLDAAAALASAREEPDPQLRREILQAAGILPRGEVK